MSTGVAPGFPGMKVGQVHGLIREACDAAGGQKAWANQHGMSPSYVSEVLHMKREPGPAILDALGVVRVVRYLRKADLRKAQP